MGKSDVREKHSARTEFQRTAIPRQGFGRLIRTKVDEGLVAILDPRVLTKAYGRGFVDALPPCRMFIDGVAADEG